MGKFETSSSLTNFNIRMSCQVSLHTFILSPAAAQLPKQTNRKHFRPPFFFSISHRRQFKFFLFFPIPAPCQFHFVSISHLQMALSQGSNLLMAIPTICCWVRKPWVDVCWHCPRCPRETRTTPAKTTKDANFNIFNQQISPVVTYTGFFCFPWCSLNVS